MAQATGTIHAARLSSSDRLQRLLEYLRDGKEHTTLNIVLGANICAVNSAVAELRENGYLINCRRVSNGCYAYI